VHRQSGKLTEIGVLGPQILTGVTPKCWTKFIKLHLYPTFQAIKVAYRSSNLEDSAAKEKRKKLLLKNGIPPLTIRVGGGSHFNQNMLFNGDIASSASLEGILYIFSMNLNVEVD